MRLRLINRDFPQDPHMNLAADEAVFLEVMRGNSPPTFRFYRNDNAVILGCFQLAEQETHEDVIKAKGIKIAKRFTGGGAVYHDMGDLNYSVISKDVFGVGKNVEKMFSTMIGGAVTSFRELGLESVGGGLNDVTVNGKKILGSAATIRSDTILFHAAVLVSTNLQTLASVLKVPGMKLRDKGAQTILDRVVNIYDICGKEVEDVRQAILKGYSKELGFEYDAGDYTKRETELAKELHSRKYTLREWNHGKEIINLY